MSLTKPKLVGGGPLANTGGPLGPSNGSVNPIGRGTLVKPPATPHAKPDSPIPTVVIGKPPSSIVSANTLNATGTPSQDRQQQIAAENALLCIPYGRTSVGAAIADVLFLGGNLVIIAVWGQGPINAIEQIYFDDKILTSGVSITNYLGTQVAVDGQLVTAYAAQGITFTDFFPGIAYSVIQLAPGFSTGFPRISAVLQGLKVYDPRDGTQTLGTPSTYKYSDNPALCLADLETNTTYGARNAIDWTTVTTAANACDALVGGVEKRRTIGVLIDNAQDIETWRDTLRAYAGCFVGRAGASVVLVPDRPASSSATFSETTGNCRVKNVKRRTKRDVPTVVAIRYTDTSVYPWRDRLAYAYAAGVQAGTVPWKVTEVAMPGVTRGTQAIREAIERLNKLELTDLTLDLEAADEAIAVTLGDVVTVTANLGLSARTVRVLNPSAPAVGRPVFSCEGYDATVYSDSVTATPSVTNTTLPNPALLAAPTALVITETVYLERVNGSSLAAGMVYQSRFDCSWTAPSSTYPVTYRVEVYDNTTKVRDDQVSGTTYSTPAVQQGKTYTVKVFSRNTTTECATPLVGSLLAQGKLLPPGPVPSVSGQVLGGIVLLSWQPAIDIDVMRYEWRYFPNGTGTWATATFIDRIDGLGARFQGLPVGTHRFYVRAIDSVGNYSTSDATIDLTVTQDANSFLQSKLFSSPTLVNMIAIAMLEGVWTPRWETAVTGDQWSTVEPSPLNSGGNAVDSYHAAGTSSWTGESWDLGTTVTGDWTLTPNEQDDSGVATFALQTSPDGSTWTTQPGISWKGSTRFIRPFISTTGSMIVKDKPKIQLAAVSKTESGTVTTSATLATLVQLSGQYSGAQDLQATPVDTSSPRFCVADRRLFHPQTGLMLQDDTTAGDAFFIQNISSAAYTIVAGDCLEYDVFIDPGTPAATTFSDGGVTLVFSDASTANAINDADGFACGQPAVGFDALARGVWKSRKILLTPKATLGTTTFRVRLDSDGVGTHKVLFRNIRITDGGATTRVTAYGTTGEPTVNTTFGSALSTNMKCGPSNSFNLYVFTDAGAQVAQLVQWSFKGY